MSCQAKQVNEQMHCHACGLQWDVKDPEPPACRRLEDWSPRQLSLGVGCEGDHTPVAQPVAVVPVELPAHVAAEMAQAYHANLSEGYTGRLRAMRAAWRVALDRLPV